MDPYVGRFAPTPSGALHFGSLVTALGSWLDARSSGGRWKLRIDDLDLPRVKPGAESQILRQLDDHGLNWDGAIRRQSEHVADYRAALDVLRRRGSLYACRCTRARLAAIGGEGDDGEPIYPGICREAGYALTDAALRFRSSPGDASVGDFVVCRRDGTPAYQLACAVDEAAQGITDVVRGADLVASGRRQIQLTQALGLPTPRYRYLPLVLDAEGRKLGKRNEARPLESRDAAQNLRLALVVLGQPLPSDAEGIDKASLLAAATRAWRVDRIPEASYKFA